MTNQANERERKRVRVKWGKKSVGRDRLGPSPS